jgi:transposase
MGRISKSEKVVKEIKRYTRKKYSAEEKIRIVLEGLRGEYSIAELCRKEGLNHNTYYRWSKEFLEAGKESLSGSRSSRADKSVEAKIEELEKVIGRQTVVIEVLKKNLRLA